MLLIKKPNGLWKEWHVGEPFPTVEGLVVTFQADSDELTLLLRALQQPLGDELMKSRRERDEYKNTNECLKDQLQVANRCIELLKEEVDQLRMADRTVRE